MTGSEQINAGSDVMVMDNVAHSEPGAAADAASDQILALLARIGEPVDVANAPEIPVQVEFGIEALQDMIADSGTSPTDELAALVGLGDAGGVDLTGGASAAAAASTDLGSGLGGVDQLAIKIIFGYDEENGTTTS